MVTAVHISGFSVQSFSPSQFHPRFTGGHKQTLYAWARPRHFPSLPAPEERFFDVAPDARVLAHCHVHGTHHCVVSMKTWCERKAQR